MFCTRSNWLSLLNALSFDYSTSILFSFSRLREYETVADGSIKRGPEVTGVHFVILEMAREWILNYFIVCSTIYLETYARLCS